MDKWLDLFRLCYLSSARECEGGMGGVLGTHPAELTYKLCDRLKVWGDVRRQGARNSPGCTGAQKSQYRSGGWVWCKLPRVWRLNSAWHVPPRLSLKAGYGMCELV